MINIAKRAIYGSLILLVMPVSVWISGWTWKPYGSSDLLKSFYWVTETSSFPWAGITCVVLALWFSWLLKLRFKQTVLLIGVLAIAILLGQGVKSAIKETVEEPRPFVLWLESEYKIDDEKFYNLPRQARASLLKQALKNDWRVPYWLSQHWQDETGYAFPSGHALFTASWALLGVVLLWPRRHYISVVVLVCWAIIVAASRLMMGMHWPSDLIVSTVIGGLIAFAVGIVVERYGLMKDRKVI